MHGDPLCEEEGLGGSSSHPLCSARSKGLRWALGTGATLGLSLDFIRGY